MQNLISKGISDDLWSKVEPLVPLRSRSLSRVYQRADGGGRKPLDSRDLFSSIIYVLRNQLPWRAIPRSMGSVSTLNRYFVSWKRNGFFERLYKAQLFEHPELKGIQWNALSLLDCPIHPLNWSRTKRQPNDEGAAGQTPTAETPSISLTPVAQKSEVRESPSILHPRIQARILRLHGSTEVSGFWSATQALLKESIPHDATTAYLNFLDHPRTWRAARILVSPNANMPAAWFERRWKGDFTTPFIHSHQGIKVFTFSDVIQDPCELQRSAYLKEFFEPYGWHHTAILSFWNGNKIFSTVAIRRTKKQGAFQPSEMEFLRKLHPHINTVLRRLIPSHEDKAKLKWLMDSAKDIPDALMFLDWNLDLLHVNSEAQNQCAIWNFGPQKAKAYNPREVLSIPPEIRQACTMLKAEWLCRFPGALNGKEETLSVRIAHTNDNDRTAKIFLASSSREAIFRPSFQVQFKFQTTEAQNVADRNKGNMLWRLTSAERDLMDLASTGCKNGEIAVRLHKSVNTVKHQLTSIYSKLGIDGSRRCRLEIIRSVNSSIG